MNRSQWESRTRRVAGAGEKGGAKVARPLLGGAGSRFHLAVDAAGAPLEVRLAAGNENERQHLLPLLDALAARKIQPAQLWADRGYASRELEQQLRQRGIEPRISQPRRAGQPIPPGTPSRADRNPDNSLASPQSALIVTLLRHF